MRLPAWLGSLVCLSLLLLAGDLRAAITFDNASSGQVAAATSVSFSHTIGSGSDRMLVVVVATEDSTAGDAIVSSVTYNGTAMTAVASSRSTLTSTSTNESVIFYLLNASLPAAGTYTVQINTAGGTTAIIGGATSLFGVRQQAAEAVATGNSTTSTISTSITTVTSGAWVVDVLSNGGASPNAFTTTAAGMVERIELAGSGHSMASATKPTTTAGSTAMSWSHSQFGRETHSVAAFAATPTLTGTVFEDVTYAGGAGRSLATSSGSVRSGARVELFNSSGNFLSATTTDASGNYSFAVTASTSYTVRVVNGTVTSSLGGASLVPVQTFRTTATTGSAVAVTDRVGGENPGLSDAGNGSTTLAALTAGSLTPQSITAVTVGTGSVAGLDFGFNFNTVVNNNDTAQGSLRQLITNANAMTGTQSSVFMITDGLAHPGLRAGLASDLTGGVAVITLASLLPQITDTITLDATTQTTNVGNTNAGTLGTGGTVGVDAVSLTPVNRPEVEIVCGQSSSFSIAAANSTVRGFALRGTNNNPGNFEIGIIGVNGVTISGNVIGASATSFTLPATGRTEGIAINVSGAVTSGTITGNLIGFARYQAIFFATTTSGITVSLNEITASGRNSSNYGGIDLLGSSHTISSNLFTANKGQAIDNWTAANNSHTIVNNTITGNGVGTQTTRETSGIRLRGSNSLVDRNIVAANYGAGILINTAGSGNRLTQNSIYSNGTITNDSAEAASGQIGIDLQISSENNALGTAPYYTLNDSGDPDGGGNTGLNSPVIDTARIVGANLVVTGWARPASAIEFFISDSDPSGFGEGQTYLASFTEGGGSDTDATSSSYSGTVNGLAQGSDTTNRFTFTVALPGGVSHGTKITATATDASNNTSEFSGQATVTNTVALTGTVFEDVTYAGGAGRTMAASSGVARSGARVELFDASGTYISATTTDGAGAYSFNVPVDAAYTVRVVNSSVTSSLGGTSLIPVQTYRTTATTGSAVAVNDRVGGEDPAKADAGDGSTTLAALTAGSLTPQSITSATVASAAISGLNFGYNFNTVVNTTDTGQGSLRQLITNANGMSGTQTSVFMITDGLAHPGLRAGLASDLTGGVAVITLASLLPQITGTLNLDATTQTTNVGNTNAGTLGTGGTVGVDALALLTVNRPEVEIITSSLSVGLDVAGANSTVRGFAIHGAAVGQAEIAMAANGITLTQNVICTTATSFTLPGSNASAGQGIRTSGTLTSGTISNNLIGFANYQGIVAGSTTSGFTVSGNEIRGSGRSNGTLGGIDLLGTGHTISGNLIVANKGSGVDNWQTGHNTQTILNNTISGNGVGTLSARETSGIRVQSNGYTIDRNVISNNYGAGILVTSAASGNTITRNSIFGNGTILNDAAEAATGNIGIDLQVAGNDADVGTAPYYTINDSGDGDTGGNGLLNFPVITSAYISGGNLVLTGFARPGAVIEVFIADSDPSNFGEGQTYQATLTEGSGADTDAGTGTYTNPVNGLNQGTDTTNRFTFTIPTPVAVVVGTRLTSTATLAAATSEFSGVATVTATPFVLTGTVFEDVTYAGGVGRSQATSSGVARAGARVELYTAAGAFSSFTTTDGSGAYSFPAAPSTSYTVRVVNDSVTSSLGGVSLMPVQTYRTTGTTGSAVAVTDRVGGENPGLADAGNGASTLAALTAGSLTPQSITSVTVGAANVTGLDFGYNFNTVVNNNDTAQGSLRQLITNANAMTGTQTSVFMITDGLAHPGLRAGLASDLTGGVAVITLATLLPQITDTITLDATSQTTNIGNTNAGTLGTGGTVGVDALALPTVNRPEVEIITSSLAAGFNIAGANSTVRGFAIHGAANGGVNGEIVVTGVNGVLINQNVIGTTAGSFTLPATFRANGSGILASGTITSCTISANLVGFTNFNSVSIATTTSGITITQNEIRGGGRANANSGGIELLGTGNTVSRNLLIANKSCGVDNPQAGNDGHTIVNNTLTGNGVGTAGIPETAAIRLHSSSITVDRNIITLNYGPGVMLMSANSGNLITRNSIFDNGTITNDASAAASGQIGIDLLSAADSQEAGTAPFVTINDSGDGDAGGNALVNFPVIETGSITGANLVLTGFARPGSVIELFIADNDPSNFGEGQTYLTTLTEGSGADTDAGTGTYTNPVNGLNQGTDTTNRFTFTIPVPGGVSSGSRLTATATVAGATSEFSGVATVTASSLVITGTVFEDVTYAGGVGRSQAASSGVVRPGARVELYTAAGAFSTFATTDVSGAYSFAVVPSTSYTIRVVNDSVTSSLGGASLVPVQTFRTTGTTGAAVAVTDRVGGENPGLADAGNGSTTLAALTAGSLTPQSITAVNVGVGGVTGVDFGFNFNTVVNNNDTAQGSLRQLITNANGMTGTQTSVFMITDGLAHPGLRAGLASDLTGGVAVITLSSLLPQITGTLNLDATTQTTNVGNTNAGTLGTGGTVGVDALTLSTVARPEVEIVGSNGLAQGLDIAAASTTIRGLAIHGFGNSSTRPDILVTSGDNLVLTQLVIGASATSFTLPAAASGGPGIRANAGVNGSLTNSLIGFTAANGLTIAGAGTSGWLVENCEFRACGGATLYGGIDIAGTGTTVRGNLLAANKAQGFDSTAAATTATVVNNTITGNGVGAAAESSGVRMRAANATVDRNIITTNYGAGVLVSSTTSNVRITRNSIFANGTIGNDSGAAATGQIGIDLLSASDNSSLGNAPYYTINDSGDGDTGGNGLLNFPVITATYVTAGNLVITGFARPGAEIELFIADSDPSNFGEGQTYLTTLTEGSGADTDAGTGTYTNPVNGLNQGTDTTNRFTFTIPVPGGVAAGTRLTSTATLSNSTSEFSGVATVFTGLTISGTVYNDANRNSRKETTETGTGLTLYVKLIDPALPPASPALSVATVTPATGDYTLGGVTTGLYTLVLDDNATLADVTPTLPAGWTALEGSGGRRPNVAVAAVPVSAQDFGLSQGMPITGKVFVDTGTGAGTANNGVQDGTEAGLAGIVVKLTNSTGATTYSTATTDGSGAFGLSYPTTLTTGTQLKIVQQNATGYVSTGAGVGDTAGTYVRATDTVTFTLTANASYTGVAFGDVPATTLNTDGAQTALPGSTIHYPHTFTAGTAGTVTFSVTYAPTPPTPGWSPALYRDTNANGVFDTGEPQITAPIAVTAGQVVAVLVKEFVPLNAPFGAQDQTTLTAGFVYANAPAITATRTRRDLTTVGEPQNGALLLTKAVDKATALPGQTLTYTVTYTNRGPAPLNTLVIHDATPAFSNFTSATNGPLPASLTGVVLTAPGVGATGAIRWNFTGPLAPGSTGTVSFTVTIDQ